MSDWKYNRFIGCKKEYLCSFSHCPSQANALTCSLLPLSEISSRPLPQFWGLFNQLNSFVSVTKISLQCNINSPNSSELRTSLFPAWKLTEGTFEEGCLVDLVSLLCSFSFPRLPVAVFASFRANPRGEEIRDKEQSGIYGCDLAALLGTEGQLCFFHKHLGVSPRHQAGFL